MPKTSQKKKSDGALKVSENDFGSSYQKIISEVRPYDVLLGRGKPYHDHPGNLRLHEIVNIHRKRYKKAPKSVKTAIVDTIVREIQVAGDASGRFLKRVSAESADSWIEISDLEAREKVSHALRGKPRRLPSSMLSKIASEAEESKSISSSISSRPPSSLSEFEGSNESEWKPPPSTSVGNDDPPLARRESSSS